MRYEYIIDTAAALLLSQRRHSIKVDPLRLQYSYPVIFDTIQSYCEKTTETLSLVMLGVGSEDGFTLIPKHPSGRYVVLYNGSINAARRAFTLAHEIGHIYLRHTRDDPESEAEANHFASCLLAPRILLWEMKKRAGGKITAGDISGYFALSREAPCIACAIIPREPVFSGVELKLLSCYKGLLPQPGNPVMTV